MPVDAFHGTIHAGLIQPHAEHQHISTSFARAYEERCILNTSNTVIASRWASKAAAVVLAVAIICLLMPVPQAHAESLEELAAKVNETSEAYNDAVAEQERLASEIESTASQIAELEEKLPGLTAKANVAIIGLYKQGDTTDDILNALLGMQSLSEAIKYWEDYNKIMDYSTGLVTDCVNAKNALAQDKEQLETDKAAQDETVAAAKEAYDKAVQARTAAQAAARAQASGSALASAIDWNMPKDEFVEHWGARINRYLSGTPLSGHGEAFADAAYQNGADPRFSPAISRIESGCGAHCFRPHNAWGWMGKSFGDWDSAIYAHVKYLAGPLYGGYLTLSGAKTYCPPTYQDWYNKVAGEMNRM